MLSEWNPLWKKQMWNIVHCTVAATRPNLLFCPHKFELFPHSINASQSSGYFKYTPQKWFSELENSWLYVKSVWVNVSHLQTEALKTKVGAQKTSSIIFFPYGQIQWEDQSQRWVSLSLSTFWLLVCKPSSPSPLVWMQRFKNTS